MLIATLFSIVDLPAALESPTGLPFIEIFRQSTGSIAGSATMASVIVTLALFANCNYLASTSRMTWSFARDRGLPGWRSLIKVRPYNDIHFIGCYWTLWGNISMLTPGVTGWETYRSAVDVNSRHRYHNYPSLSHSYRVNDGFQYHRVLDGCLLISQLFAGYEHATVPPMHRERLVSF